MPSPETTERAVQDSARSFYLIPADRADMSIDGKSVSGSKRCARLLIAAVMLMLLAVTGCDRQDGDRSISTAPSGLPQASNTPAAFTDYRVQVTMSPAARETLAQGRETLIIDADYYATPVPAAADQADDVGQLDLGRDQQELNGEGSAEFNGAGFLGDRVELIEGEPQVNINVYSGRKSSPDNVLNCDFFQDALRVAARAPVTLHCMLIDEPTAGSGQQ